MAARSLRPLCAAASSSLRRSIRSKQELGAAERGSHLHDALDEFLKAYPEGALPADALQRFERMGEKHLASVLAAPAERAFWWPRFQRLARWFIATESGAPRRRHEAAGERDQGRGHASDR